MRRRSVPLHVASVAVFVGLVGAVACENPTEVTLVLTTNLPCATLQGTTITVGTADEIEEKAPVAETGKCIAGSSGLNTIGTFVLVPSQGRSAAFAVRIVSGVDRLATDCAPGGGQTPDYSGCIVARRELAFVPHTPLTLPIVMSKECENIPCTAQETCVEGECVPSIIPDPNHCAGSAGCSETTLLEGGGIEAGPEDAALLSDGAESDEGLADAPATVFDGQTTDAPLSDGASSGGRMLDAAPPDAAMRDATVADAPGPDAPGPDSSQLDAAPQDASGPGDASILGSCVGVGTSAGVTCGSATCAHGDVCCVALPTTGSPTYSCTSPASCDTTATGETVYSALACRDVGDCTAGNVCCLVGSTTVGNSYTTTCKASCQNFSTVQACTNSCECTGPVCTVAPQCSWLSIATCGGACN
ncbi:MAG: hypothetical protein ACLP1X_26215 [Polyangiaceae bacterium]